MYEVLYLCLYRPVWRHHDDAWSWEEALQMARQVELGGRPAAIRDEAGQTLYVTPR